MQSKSIKLQQILSFFFVFGLFLGAVSPTAVVLGGNPLRIATLAGGISLVLLSVLSGIVRAFYTETLTPWALLLLVAATIETFSVVNSQFGYSINSVLFRLICYTYAGSGLTFAEPTLRKYTRSSLAFELLIGSVALICSALWLLSANASGQGAQRFFGDDDAFSPVGLAFSFGTASVLCFTVGVFAHSWLGRIASMQGAAGLLLCVLSTGSRGAIVAVMFTMGLLMLVRIRELIRSPSSIVAVVVLAAGLAFAIKSVPAISEQGQFVLDRFYSIANAEDDMALVERQVYRDHYFANAKTWVLTGDPRYGETGYPHNLFIELFVRFGVPVGLLFSLLVIASACRFFLWLSSRTISESSFLPALIGLIGIYSLVISQFNLSLEVNRPLFCFVAFWCSMLPEAAPKWKRTSDSVVQ